MTNDYTLAYGTHARPEDGRCAMEWVSYLAGEPHSDDPSCVSRVLRAMCIALNDGLEQAPRQRLRPYLTRTIGTAGDGLDTERGWMAMDWLVRDYTPTWLALAGLPAAAGELAGLAPVDGAASLGHALPTLDAARRRTRVERARTYGVPRPIGWTAAIGAGLAGREAAWAGAGAAAWAAARVSICHATASRACAAARLTAGDAAAIAVRRSRAAAARRGAAREAARAVLEPAQQALVDSILALLDRMLPTEVLELPAVVGAAEAGAAGAAVPGRPPR